MSHVDQIEVVRCRNSELNCFHVLAEQEELEKEVAAVLGPSDAKNCSYDNGYMKRQALYACLTCRQPENGKPNGICLACSLSCHDEHDLVELYTKRNFRCDCGNDRLKNTPCQLQPMKGPENPENLYNHNFEGRYCTCDRPFPDEEYTGDDPGDMLQCALCEDWFHFKHLDLPDSEASSSDNAEFADVTCKACMQRHGFLQFYANHLSMSPVCTGCFRSSRA